MDKKEQNKLISYFIMGDGGVYRREGKNTNANFIMNILAKHRDYAEEIVNLIDFTSVKITDVPDYMSRGHAPLIRVESMVHPRFTEYRNRIYTDRYKGLDPMYIKQLDWHSLAILYQADGCLGECFRPDIGMTKPSYSTTLNMKRLSYGDLYLLGQYLTKNLGLFWSINKHYNYYFIRFKMKSFDRLMQGMEPYIHESFKYKIRTFSPSVEGGEMICTS